MPSRRPKLQDFERADQDHGDRRRQQPVAAIGQAERDADQDEGERMFAVLAEVGVRAKGWRSQRCEGNRCRQRPGEESEDGIHLAGLARFVRLLSASYRSRRLEVAVWLTPEMPESIAVPARPCRA